MVVPVKRIPYGEGSVIGKLNPRYFSLETVRILFIWNDLDSKFELSAGLLSTMAHSSQQFSFFYLYEKTTYPLPLGTTLTQSDQGPEKENYDIQYFLLHVILIKI